MTDDLVTLDTNVLVYAADIEAGVRHGRALEILGQARFARCVLTLQALSEFFSAVTRRRGMPVSDAIDQIEDWQQIFTIVAARPEALGRALGAVKRHRLSFWDALLYAAARDAGVTLLLSEDYQHGA